jgi:tetratricopeptide (TPR) repeat protein
MKYRISGRIILALCLLLCGDFFERAYSQQNGSSGSDAGGGSGKEGPPTPPQVIPIISPTVPIKLPPREIQPIFISGNVMQEDGSFPPNGAMIEMDCGGTKTREAMVTPNGRFSFQYGGSRKFSDLVPDAGDSNAYINDEASIYWSPVKSGEGAKIETTTPLNIRLSGCDLRAQLAGYRSSFIRLNGTVLTSVNEVGSIILYPEDKVRGTSISAVNLLAPKKAKSLLKQAAKAVKKQKPDEAERLLKSATEIYPRYIDAWVQLGTLYQKRRLFDEAYNAFKKAVAIDPLFVVPHIRMCWAYADEKNWRELAAAAERALVLDPVSYPELYFLSAIAHYNLQNFVKAEKRAGQSKLRDTYHYYPKTHLILANIFENKNDWAASKEELGNYLRFAPNASDALLVRKRLKGITDKAALQSVIP